MSKAEKGREKAVALQVKFIDALLGKKLKLGMVI